MLRPKHAPPRGLLRPDLPIPGYRRFWPDADLAPFVEHFWTVEWNLPEPLIREVLPHPSFHLVLEQRRSAVVGVPKSRFTRQLAGEGRVLAAKFHPGAFRTFLPQPASTYTGRRATLKEIFREHAKRLEARVLSLPDPADAFDALQHFLRSRQPALDDRAELAGRIVRRAATDRDITRVDRLLDAFDIGPRQAQRLFADYVGVSPKWVIQRYRLHEAADRIAANDGVDRADLALQLGYADQAHFIRDFRKWIGRTPAAYGRDIR